MQAARTRLGTVLETAGLVRVKTDPGASAFGAHSSTGSSSGQLAAESALAKQNAAANALRVKAEQASRTLAAQQRDLDARSSAMSGRAEVNEGQWQSNRHRKAQNFFAKQRENRGGKGKGKKGGGKSSGKGKGSHQSQAWT